MSSALKRTLQPIIKSRVNNEKTCQKKNGLNTERKHITSIEAERIMTVFDQLIWRVSILAALPSVIDSLEEFELLLGSQLIVRIKTYSKIREEYNIRVEKLKELRSEITKHESDQRDGDQDAQNQLFGDDFWEINLSPSQPNIDQTGNFLNRNNRGTVLVEPFQMDVNTTIERTKSKSTHFQDAQFLIDSQEKHLVEEFLQQKSKEESIIKNMNLLIPEMQCAVRHILQGFQANLAAANALINHTVVWKINRSSVNCDILAELKKLRKILFLRMITSPEIRDKRLDHIKFIGFREDGNTNTIEKLELEHMQAFANRANEIEVRNKQIISLQYKYHELEKEAKKRIDKIKIDSEEFKSETIKKGKENMKKLREELADLRQKLAFTQSSNRESETNLRRRKWKMEHENETIIAKYDDEFGDKNVEYEEINEIYMEEQNQLEVLQTNFTVLEKEYKQVMEDRRLEALRLEHIQKEQLLLVESATIIQSFWRSYKVRRQLKKRRAKK